ncbi:MAG: carboxyvinyl-carboxyphosphonate phosphorylmutase, partial [Actinomycetota bacterium]
VKNESFDAAVDRANAYAAAGADAVLLMPSSADEWVEAPRRIEAPLVTFSSLAARPTEEWATLGWRVVLDPFSAQVLAHQLIEDAYRGVLRGDGFGRSEREIMAGYARLPEAAGLDELYDIERATTEPGT